MSKAPTKTWSTTTRFNLYNPAFAQFMSASMLSPVPLVFTSPSHFLIWVSLPNPATRKESIPHRQSIATCYCTRPNKKKKKTQKPASTTPNLEIRYRWSQNMSKPEICHRTPEVSRCFSGGTWGLAEVIWQTQGLPAKNWLFQSISWL